MGDALDSLPLLNAVRRLFPHAYLTVACDPGGTSIMEACNAVNEIIVLKLSRSPWWTALRNASRLQNHDWALAVKSDFNRQLALMTRFSNAKIRVGFERRIRLPSAYFTDTVPLPEDEEHQTATLMRLLKPLGMVKSTGLSTDLSLRVPHRARAFAKEVMNHPPFHDSKHYMLINITRTPGLKFREEDFIALISRLLNSTQFAVGLVATPPEQPFAFEMAAVMGSDRIAAVETPEALDLAAMLEQASFLVTPESPIAHLAAAVGTPALVLWHGDFFERRHSLGRRHTFVRAEPGEANIPLERVWQALMPFLGAHQQAIEQKMSDLMDLPPLSDFI
jgi:ADP-heptose:LPS heptosyltransferase